MATAVKASDDLFAKAKIKSKLFKRSIVGQIEYRSKIGQMVEENPDLPINLPFTHLPIDGHRLDRAPQVVSSIVSGLARNRRQSSSMQANSRVGINPTPTCSVKLRL